MYEDVLKERRSQNTLLMNLQSIQNNLERSEFETKSQLGRKIEGLEREVAGYKQRLSSEEERRGRMGDAYELQVRLAGWLAACLHVCLPVCLSV